MASVKGPLMSMDASGSIGGAITFSKWKGRAYVRELVRPSNPQSGLQMGVRAMLKFVTQIYTSLSAGIKTNWATAAKPDKITPMNAMVRKNQTNVRINAGAVQDPTLVAVATEAAPTGTSATAQVKSVKLVWVDSIGADDWCTFVYSSPTVGFTATVATLVAVIPKGVQVYTQIGLKSGVIRYFRLGGCAKPGNLGTLAAELNATPT